MGRRSNQKLARRIGAGRVSVETKDAPWTPLERAVSASTGNHHVNDGTDTWEMWRNSRYTVLSRVVAHMEGRPETVHLSIRRNDRRPVMNWRDMQAIKNELVGPECEGVQIFPAESRLVDNANQFHLFVCTDPEMRFPGGYEDRLVSEGNFNGSVQEPFEDHVRPADLPSEEKVKALYDEYHRKNPSSDATWGENGD